MYVQSSLAVALSGALTLLSLSVEPIAAGSNVTSRYATVDRTAEPPDETAQQLQKKRKLKKKQDAPEDRAVRGKQPQGSPWFSVSKEAEKRRAKVVAGIRQTTKSPGPVGRSHSRSRCSVGLRRVPRSATPER
jgi:hypothetical protein